jgi:hypothetical protein
MMKVLVLSWGFPNHQRPALGVFVRERIKALARRSEVRVVAPVKWFPFGHRLAATTRSRVARCETQDGLEVFHPRYFTFPFVFRSCDGFLYFLSVLRIVRKLRRDFPFDLIDAHFAYPDGFAAVLLGQTLQDAGRRYAPRDDPSSLPVLAAQKGAPILPFCGEGRIAAA